MTVSKDKEKQTRAATKVARKAKTARTVEASSESADYAENSVFSFFRKAMAITELEVRKLWHDPTDILTRSFQPVIWLLLFGQVLAQTHFVVLKNMSYLEYITPGILAQSILFVAIFHGLSVIWERDLGIVQKLLVTPIPRIALVLGKSWAAGIRALTQVIVIYLLALVINVKLNHSLFSILGVSIVTVISAGIFSTFSLIIASIVKTRERFMGIGQVLIMPLFFASNAIYPISIMPTWLKIFANVNPLSYEVDALRMLMLKTNSSFHGLTFDIAVLTLTLLVMLFIAARLYPRLAN
jgi:ABC-2 type transport system permease protein